VLDQLQQLHPPCDEPLPDLPADAPQQPVFIDAITPNGRKDLRHVLRKLNNGSAAGPSGMNGAHLAAIAGDNDCLVGIARLMQDICNGVIEGPLREYILSSTLIPLDKGNGKVRPIAIGEQLKRAADVWMNSQVLGAATELCKPHQFGIGIRGGIEKALHAVQAMLSAPGHGNVAFLVDIVNAFNAKSRARILREIYSNPTLKACWRLVHWTYGSETPLRLTNGQVIMSRNGVKQGETLGSLMFAVSMRRVYAEAASVHPDTVRLFCVMDDATFVGPAEHVIDCVAKLCELLEAEHLHINFTKSCLLAHPTNQLSPRVSNWLATNSVPLVRDAAKLLGAPVGWDTSKMGSMLRELLDESTPIFNQLLDPGLSSQEALLILRISTLPTFGYLTRVITPRLLSDTAKAFDARMLATATNRLDLPHLTVDQTKQLRLKLRLGGFGLTATAEISPIAYTSAFMSAHEVLSEPLVLGTNGLQRSNPYCIEALQAIEYTRELVGNQKASKWVPPKQHVQGASPTVLSWVRQHASGSTHLPLKLQSAFARSSDRNHFNVLLRSCVDVSSQARFRSISAPSASRWLTAIPTTRETTMTNKDMSIASRIRLGVQLFDGRAHNCACGEANGKAGVDALHALSCLKVRKTAVNFRHNLFGSKFATCAGRVGCIVTREPQSDSSQQRGDYELVTPAGDVIWFDNTIVQPSAPTWTKGKSAGSHLQQLYAADTQAARKHAKYDPTCREQKIEFFAVAAEIFGCTNDETRALARRITDFANSEDCPFTASDAYTELMCAAAISIQVGNARCAKEVHTMNVRAGLAVQPYARPPAEPASPLPASPRRAAPAAPPSPASPEVQIMARSPAQQQPARLRVDSVVPARELGFGDEDDQSPSSVPLPEEPATPPRNGLRVHAPAPARSLGFGDDAQSPDHLPLPEDRAPRSASSNDVLSFYDENAIDSLAGDDADSAHIRFPSSGQLRADRQNRSLIWRRSAASRRHTARRGGR
jgi:Reverse transcriptase (RNA-dependent DNA polymerase)